MALDTKLVNVIWEALETAKYKLMSRGRERMKHSAMVDFIVSETLAILGDGAVTREQVLEAWLYQSLEQTLRLQGNQPLPPRKG